MKTFVSSFFLFFFSFFFLLFFLVLCLFVWFGNEIVTYFTLGVMHAMWCLMQPAMPFLHLVFAPSALYIGKNPGYSFMTILILSNPYHWNGGNIWIKSQCWQNLMPFIIFFVYLVCMLSCVHKGISHTWFVLLINNTRCTCFCVTVYFVYISVVVGKIHVYVYMLCSNETENL